MAKLKLYEQLQKEGRVIPAIEDTLFKKIITEHKDYLGIILEDILPLTKEAVMEGQFFSTEIPSSNMFRKSNRLDLVLKSGGYKLKLEANRKITIKLLLRNEAYFSGMIYQDYNDKENLDYNTNYCQVNFNGQNYLKKKLVITLTYHDKILDVEEKRLSKIHLNLGIALKKYYNKEKLSRFEKALVLLLLEEKEKIKKLVEGDEILEKVAKDIMSYSEARAIVDTYEAEIIERNIEEYSREYEIKKATEKATKKATKKALKEGKKLGHKKGLEEGHKEGHKEGLEEGRKEGIVNRNIELAILMLQKGEEINKILEYTNLSIEKIKNLKTEISKEKNEKSV